LKVKRISATLLALIITACNNDFTQSTLPVAPKQLIKARQFIFSETGLTKKDINDFDKEYSGFTTKAITQNYLKAKLQKWLLPAFGAKMVKELKYAMVKYPALYKAIVTESPTLHTSINALPEVIQERAANISFRDFLNNNDPYPGTPTTTAATNITQNSFTANWTAVGNATGYILTVMNGVTPIEYTTGVNSYIVPNLTFSTPYSYTVKATNSAGTSSASNSINVTTISGTYTVSTFAGNNTDHFDANGTNASFSSPSGLVRDGSGNFFVTDAQNGECRVRKIASNGDVTTFAGDSWGYLNAQGLNARFMNPAGIIKDGSVLIIADAGNNRIRMVDALANATTWSGNGTAAYVNGVPTFASFNNPSDLTEDASGNLFIADTYNNRIREVATQTGSASNFSGSGAVGSANSTAGFASFNMPQGIVIDSNGSLFVADSGNNKIRMVTNTGNASTFAGGGTNAVGVAAGYADLNGSNALFNSPKGITIDGSGNLYVSDTGNNRIRKIDPSHNVTTIAGSGAAGAVDSTGTNASFKNPRGIIRDSSGNLYVADQGNRKIRKISTSGVVTTIAGSGPDANGNGTSARFYAPYGVGADINGNVFVADTNNNLIRKIDPAGNVTTFAGSTAGFADGTGTNAKVSTPRAIGADNIGNVYVSDVGNNKIRKISPAGVVTTLAGTFTLAYGVAVGNDGTVYVSDTNDQRIKKIVGNTVTTIAGNGTAGFADGTGTNAKFSSPFGIAVDSSGNLFVGDAGNNRVRKITPAGVVSTFAGGISGSLDANGTSAKFTSPSAISIDSSGNLFVAEYDQIRKITPGADVTTIAGGSSSGYVDGAGNTARFDTIRGIALDSSGNIFVADANNNRIRKLSR
jgi:sugar lactone lactonase YvrE